MSPIQDTENYHTIEDFNNLPEDFHTELINGALYRKVMPDRFHQELVGRLSTAICNYIHNKRNDCSVYMSLGAQLFKDQDTVLIPDLSVICDKSKLSERRCMGAPDWIIEIVSPSDAAHDYVDKLFFYYNAGVREYWIADPLSAAVHVYLLEPEHFDVRTYTFHDTVKAGIFEDLFIDFANLDLRM